MDWFWGAFFSTIALGWFVKSIVRNTPRKSPGRVSNVIPHEALAALEVDEAKMEETKKAKEAEERKQQYIKDLRKQGYTDDLITMVLPQLMNDG